MLGFELRECGAIGQAQAASLLIFGISSGAPRSRVYGLGDEPRTRKTDEAEKLCLDSGWRRGRTCSPNEL